MFPISREALDLYVDSYRQVIKIEFRGLKETKVITEKDIIAGGLSINRYCVSGSKIEIGSAVASELLLNLDNRDGEFNDTQFEGAELFVSIGIKKWDAHVWENAVEHWIPMGCFIIDEAPRKLENIKVAALDRMIRFDKFVNYHLLGFPMSVGQLLSRICEIFEFEIVGDFSSLPNINYIINEVPFEEKLTYRRLISWIAEITGTCAFFDWDGKLVLKWYGDTDTIIAPKDRYISDIFENALTVNGIQVDEEFYPENTEGNIINIQSNQLIQHDVPDVAEALFNVIGGFTYTPFSATVKPMPHLYPLDKIIFVDKNNIPHPTIITDYTFTINKNTEIAGQGETAAKSEMSPIEPFTRRESAALSKLELKVSDDLKEAIREATNLITGNSGGYVVLHPAESPDEILIMDTPDLNTAVKVWRWNKAGLGYSSTGYDGEYGLAMTMDGAINAKFITAGILNGAIIKAGTISAEAISIGFTDNLQNGGLGANIDFGIFGQRIYNGDMEIYDKPKSDNTKQIVFGYDNQNQQMTLSGMLKLGGTAYIKFDPVYGGIVFHVAERTPMPGNGLLIDTGNAGMIVKTGYSWSEFEDIKAQYIFCVGIYQSSDRKKKKDIKPVKWSALKKIKSLNFYSYKFGKSHVREKIGIMAQEAPNEIVGKNGKSINIYAYCNLIAKSVQELTREINILKNQIRDLKKQI